MRSISSMNARDGGCRGCRGLHGHGLQHLEDGSTGRVRERRSVRDWLLRECRRSLRERSNDKSARLRALMREQQRLLDRLLRASRGRF
jgi:hypothetical protein